jgi:protein phosphatase
MTLRSAALTDIGKVRENNEDSPIHDPALGLYGVADGVGGLPGGAEASAMVVEILTKVLRETDPKAERLPNLRRMIREANMAVVELGRKISPMYGIASTLTFGCLRGDTLHFGHIGDSHCYLWRDGEITLLTEDHNVENDARRRGESIVHLRLSERAKGALTRCMGQSYPPEADVFEKALLPGDRVLFATDGVYRLVADSELSQSLECGKEPETILADLIGLANRRGGIDNATGVVLMLD